MVDFNSNENWPRQPSHDKGQACIKNAYEHTSGRLYIFVKEIKAKVGDNLGWQDCILYRSVDDGTEYVTDKARWTASFRSIEYHRERTVPTYDELSGDEIGKIKVSDFVRIQPGPLSSVHFGTTLFKDGEPVGKILSVERVGDVVTGKVKIDDTRKAHDDNSASVQYKPTMPRRMWVNQPSKWQIHHELHGLRVIAVHEHGDIMRVYPITGRVSSMQMDKRCLSEGWPESPEPVIAKVTSFDSPFFNKTLAEFAEEVSKMSDIPVEELQRPIDINLQPSPESLKIIEELGKKIAEDVSGKLFNETTLDDVIKGVHETMSKSWLRKALPPRKPFYVEHLDAAIKGAHAAVTGGKYETHNLNKEAAVAYDDAVKAVAFLKDSDSEISKVMLEAVQQYVVKGRSFYRDIFLQMLNDYAAHCWLQRRQQPASN